MAGIARRIGMCGLLVLCTGGCAFSYDDSAGNRHILGLVDVTIPAPARNETLAGNVVSVTTVGALVSRNAQGNTLALGYASETTAAIRDDVTVRGNPADAIHAFSDGGK